MAIASMPDRDRRPDWNDLEYESIAELKGCYSGATRSAGFLLASHLFLHLLLHFLRCGFCNVGSDHPSVTLGIDNGSTTVASEPIHHGPLGRGAELYGAAKTEEVSAWSFWN
jgi:hypothetical protein